MDVYEDAYKARYTTCVLIWTHIIIWTHTGTHIGPALQSLALILASSAHMILGEIYHICTHMDT